jgi:hypothetical protein
MINRNTIKLLERRSNRSFRLRPTLDSAVVRPHPDGGFEGTVAALAWRSIDVADSEAA